jgi:uncharacterized protein
VRLVLDSSVLIAAFITRAGVCSELLEEILMHDTLVLSRAIIDEVTQKLADKFSFPVSAIVEIRDALERYAELVEPEDVPPGICRDQDDLVVLGTAAAARADLLITVDRDLLVLQRYESADIVKPGQYWERKRDVKLPRM